VDGTYSPVLVEFPTLTLCDPSILASLQQVSKNIVTALRGEKQSAIIQVVEVKSPSSLAGLILSYPSIYYSEDNTANLLDTEVKVLSVYTNTPQQRTLMQFSCPSEFVDTVNAKLKETVKQWESRISQLSPPLKQKWYQYTGVESCILNIQIQTQKVSVLSL
jgi:hypothetical protein